MYEFMLGQGVPEGQAADYVKGTNLWRPTYCCGTGLYWVVVFFWNYSFVY
jgi:hypothetical protein